MVRNTNQGFQKLNYYMKELDGIPISIGNWI